MRIVKIPGREIKVRGLKPKEIESLRKVGLGVTKLTSMDQEDRERLEDEVLKTVLKEDDLKAVDNNNSRWGFIVFIAIIEETYAPFKHKMSCESQNSKPKLYLVPDL